VFRRIENISPALFYDHSALFHQQSSRAQLMSRIDMALLKKWNPVRESIGIFI
jgi:hypothetical protein